MYLRQKSNLKKGVLDVFAESGLRQSLESGHVSSHNSNPSPHISITNFVLWLQKLNFKKENRCFQ